MLISSFLLEDGPILLSFPECLYNHPESNLEIKQNPQVEIVVYSNYFRTIIYIYNKYMHIYLDMHHIYIYDIYSNHNI